MIYAGIDISKNFHIVHLRGTDNKQKLFRIENDMNGLSVLLKALSSFDKKEVLIGMESTGHYWKMIARKLLDNNYRLQIINSYHVKQYKEIEDNTQNKNDNKDAKIISKLLSDGKGLHANVNTKDVYGVINSLYNIRKRLIEDKKRHKTLIRMLIERHFPEYETIFKSGMWIASSITLLEKIGLSGIVYETSETIEGIIKKSSKGHYQPGIGIKIKEFYENSIGLKEFVEEAQVELEYRLLLYKSCLEALKKIETKLEEALKETEEWEYLRSIQGVGVVFASCILSELGDLTKYNRNRSVVKMSGLNLTCQSSGKSKGKLTISRRGRSELRHTAYLIALNLIRHDKNVKAYYERKLALGKEPICILIKIADKALRMIRRLIIDKEYYDSSKMYLA